MNHQHKIAHAKSVLKTAQDNLFTTYIAKIKDDYKSGDSKSRSTVLEGLEGLIIGLDGTITSEIPVVKSSKKTKTSKGSLFDGAVAKKVRTDLSLTLGGLADKVGTKKPDQFKTTVSGYENNKRLPSYPFRSEISEKYLTWLKENGYDPLNIKD